MTCWREGKTTISGTGAVRPLRDGGYQATIHSVAGRIYIGIAATRHDAIQALARAVARHGEGSVK